MTRFDDRDPDDEPPQLRTSRQLRAVSDQIDVFLDASGNESPAILSMLEASQVPAEFQAVLRELAGLTDDFCKRRLNGDYQLVCRKLAVEACQAGVSLRQGKPKGWAAGIVHAAGWVNFLHDPTQDPHLSNDEIALEFGVAISTMQGRSRAIRQALDLCPFEPRFTLSSRLEENPLIWMVEVNGIIVDMRRAPREMQEAALRQGAIPYVPGDDGAGRFCASFGSPDGDAPGRETT